LTDRRPAGSPENPPEPAGAPLGEAGGERTEEPEQRAPAQAEQQQVEADLDEMLAETRRERDEYLELAQRTRADFENYRRRVEGQAAEAEQRGAANLAQSLIGVLDNLERALRAAGVDPDAPPEGKGEGGLEHGVLLVYRELAEILQRAGVERYDPAGERFDPEWHEALATRDQEGSEPGRILEVMEKGYRLNGKVLRPARVVVSK
jgi:molecular chaperone GrpE